jgi:hypothetical protein
MIKPKRSAEQQVADEADRRALHPLATRQRTAKPLRNFRKISNVLGRTG